MSHNLFVKFTASIAVTLLVGSHILYAVADESVERQLLKRIEQSQQSLSVNQQKISAENTALSRKLNELTASVKELRDQGEKEQRKADEKLLGLEDLKKRLQDWELQSSYQQNILQSYASQFSQPFIVDESNPAIMAQSLSQFLKTIDAYFDTRVELQTLLSSGGAYEEVSVLRTGPIELAVNFSAGVSGPIVKDDSGEEKYLLEFSAGTTNALHDLQNTGTGIIVFDPTLGNAQRLKQQNQSVLEHLNLGGIWVIPILFFGCIALAIALVKAIQLMRLQDIDLKIFSRESTVANADLFSAVGGFQRKLCLIVMRTPVSQERDDLLVAGLMEAKHKLESFMGVIAMSAAVAPLLGLLGTVSGMINTFKMMNIFGVSDAATVSGGISEALITTELGLIVAIPSIVVGALLNRRVKSYCQKLEMFAINVSQISVGATGGA